MIEAGLSRPSEETISRERLGGFCQALLEAWEEALRNSPELTKLLFNDFVQGSPPSDFNKKSFFRGGRNWTFAFLRGEEPNSYRRLEVSVDQKIQAQIHVDLINGKPVGGWIVYIDDTGTYRDTAKAIGKVSKLAKEL